jgi:hypothetical protein
MGLSGSEGIGTDDATYFYQITKSKILYTPNRVALGKILSFSKFLTLIYPFKINMPLNILYINLLGISFLPYFTYKFSCTVLKQEKIASLAKKLTLFCPFTMSVGLILMRDIWITTFIIAGLYFFMKKRYLLMLLMVTCTAYIRFGSLVFMFLGLLVLFKYKLNSLISSMVISNIFFALTIIIVTLVFLLSLPVLIRISDGKLTESLFRGEFIGILTRIDENATIVKLMRLPVLVRTPLLTIFFFFSPFLKLQAYTLGVFNVRNIMYATLTPLLFFCYWRYVIKSTFFGVMYISNIRFIVAIAILFALGLGTFSLQGRHKTVLMPFLYILAAYGWYLPHKKYKFISAFGTLCIIAIQFIFL